MKLSPATPGDADILAAILSAWIDATDWMVRIHTPEEDRRFVAGLIAQGGVTVARDPGPVGFVDRAGATVRALYVAPDRRGEGVGKALLDHARAEAETLDLWCFQANEGARAFYAREGFVEAGRTAGDNDEGLPDVRLVWERSR